MDGKQIVLVKNRSAAIVLIDVPNKHIHLEVQPGQVVKMKYEDLCGFAQVPGGATMLREYLQLQEQEVEQLNLGEVEPEYNYSEEDIKNLILKGSVDEYLDCLDFAPTGVIDLIKKYAVDLPMTDMRKLEALKEKTGFDAEMALKHKREEEADAGTEEQTKPAGRRVVKSSNGQARRVVRK